MYQFGTTNKVVDSFNILSTYHLWITACTINIFNHIMFLENRPYNHLCTNQMALVYRMNLRATDNYDHWKCWKNTSSYSVDLSFVFLSLIKVWTVSLGNFMSHYKHFRASIDIRDSNQNHKVDWKWKIKHEMSLSCVRRKRFRRRCSRFRVRRQIIIPWLTARAHNISLYSNPIKLWKYMETAASLSIAVSSTRHACRDYKIIKDINHLAGAR